jgi:hypothetical protein
MTSLWYFAKLLTLLDLFTAMIGHDALICVCVSKLCFEFQAQEASPLHALVFVWCFSSVKYVKCLDRLHLNCQARGSN